MIWRRGFGHVIEVAGGEPRGLSRSKRVRETGSHTPFNARNDRISYFLGFSDLFVSRFEVFDTCFCKGRQPQPQSLFSFSAIFLTSLLKTIFSF